MGRAANDTEWAADRKVGFAMGILLIGVVAALFFRNEPLAVDDVPEVAREDLIDSRLRDRNVSVYTDQAEADGNDSTPVWSRSEIFQEYTRHDAGVAMPVGAAPTSQQPAVESVLPDATVNRSASPTPGGRPIVASPAFRPPEPLSSDEPAPDGGRVGQPPLRSQPMVATPPAAAEVRPSPSPGIGEFEEYTIQYGDTLSGIAGRKLGSSGRYREIYEANRDRMESPDRLKVGTAIRIPRL